MGLIRIGVFVFLFGAVCGCQSSKTDPRCGFLEKCRGWGLLSQQVSPDGMTAVYLYGSTEMVEEGLAAAQVLEIGAADDPWWIRPPEEALSWFGDFEFLDNQYLLFTVNSTTREQQSVCDLATRKCTVLGGGKATVIRNGKNKGLIRLSGQKHYFPREGAFWVDLLVDRDGEVIEVLSAPRSRSARRVPLTLILDQGKAYSKLRQPRHARIYVSR